MALVIVSELNGTGGRANGLRYLQSHKVRFYLGLLDGRRAQQM